jgi:hypothetical protein
MSEWANVNPEKLVSILEHAYNGEVVVPEFQRSFIWGRQQVEDLLVSVLSGYFIGNFLALDSYGKRPFPPRLVEGVQELNPAATINKPSKITYILDGQQRITAIFYALYAPPIPLKGSKSPYRFYIDVEKLLVKGAEESIVGIQTKLETEIKKADKLAHDGIYLPFKLLVNQSDALQWLWDQQTYSKTQENKRKLQEFITRIHEYPVPVISIDENIGIDAIVDTFERINRTGTRLSTFDLLVARLYPEVKLRDLWASFEEEAGKTLGLGTTEVADVIEAEYLAKVISLMRGTSCKKAVILKLSKEGFERDWDKAARVVLDAMTRLREVYGVTDLRRHVPYYAMIVPLAALLLRIEEFGKSKALYDKLDKWYWAAVFSERYESSADTYASGDYTDVSKWLAGGTMPEWISRVSASLTGDTFDTKDTRSAIYRGVICLITLADVKDFHTGQKPALTSYEDDHLFPKSKFKDNLQVDYVMNRTLIDKTTNSLKVKGAKKPSEYLELFAKNLGSEDALKEILETHLIDNKAYEAMKRDNLEDFIEARRAVILDEVKARLPKLNPHHG